MEYIRIIEFPDCRMVTSGVGMFGDKNFTRFEELLRSENAIKTPYPRDFLGDADGGFEWFLLYREGMDTRGMKVVDFKGGLYAVVCGIDAQSNADEMAAVEAFLASHNVERDPSRPELGNVIGHNEARKVLGYHQMDYFVPIKIKETKTMEELKEIMTKFAESGWDLIAGPAKQWLEGTADMEKLIAVITQADEECGSCGCDFDPLYKRALELLK